MLAVILAVAIHSAACFICGGLSGVGWKIATELPDWKSASPGHKKNVLLCVTAALSWPLIFTLLLVWYAVHKMV
jgi:hypothetical protein